MAPERLACGWQAPGLASTAQLHHCSCHDNWVFQAPLPFSSFFFLSPLLVDGQCSGKGPGCSCYLCGGGRVAAVHSVHAKGRIKFPTLQVGMWPGVEGGPACVVERSQAVCVAEVGLVFLHGALRGKRKAEVPMLGTWCGRCAMLLAWHGKWPSVCGLHLVQPPWLQLMQHVTPGCPEDGQLWYRRFRALPISINSSCHKAWFDLIWRGSIHLATKAGWLSSNEISLGWYMASWHWIYKKIWFSEIHKVYSLLIIFLLLKKTFSNTGVL